MSKGARHVAISLRFAEASPEMTALKAALAAKSYEVLRRWSPPSRWRGSHLLESPEALRAKIQEALDVLRQHSAQVAASTDEGA